MGGVDNGLTLEGLAQRLGALQQENQGGSQKMLEGVKSRGLGMRVLLVLAAMVLAIFASVATTEERAGAEDVATRVEGEIFDDQPIGTSVVTNTTLYAPPDGKALKFSNNTAIAETLVNFTSSGDVVLMARASQSGGSPKLRVSVNGTFTAPAQAITNSGSPQPYTFHVNAPSGINVRIGVQAANTGTGRKPFLDYVTFPPSGGGGGGSLTYIGSATGDTGATAQVNKVTVPVHPGTQQG